MGEKTLNKTYNGGRSSKNVQWGGTLKNCTMGGGPSEVPPPIVDELMYNISMYNGGTPPPYTEVQRGDISQTT